MLAPALRVWLRCQQRVRCEDHLAVDVWHVIKHYAAKGRLEPNHKIDSAYGNPIVNNFAHQNKCVG
ncbi:hypothetical protein EFT36_18695 [Raoultella ornithinolytica]|nr:hypothetical protein EFT36_18695 [Raoultella ornithinolytica]KAB8133320.1 hypothetical protein FNH10_15450 [Raoultella ornithinolytica]HCJ05640.1 hypothetical protein [Raoultella ornithinolytica]